MSEHDRFLQSNYELIYYQLINYGGINGWLFVINSFPLLSHWSAILLIPWSQTLLLLFRSPLFQCYKLQVPMSCFFLHMASFPELSQLFVALLSIALYNIR